MRDVSSEYPLATKHRANPNPKYFKPKFERNSVLPNFQVSFQNVNLFQIWIERKENFLSIQIWIGLHSYIDTWKFVKDAVSLKFLFKERNRKLRVIKFALLFITHLNSIIWESLYTKNRFPSISRKCSNFRYSRISRIWKLLFLELTFALWNIITLIKFFQGWTY